MELGKLASKPQLIKLSIDDPDVITEFGEALDFYTYDRQPLDIFLNLSATFGVDQSASLDILNTLILDSKGAQVISDGRVLPAKLLVKVMAKIMDTLGK